MTGVKSGISNSVSEGSNSGTPDTNQNISKVSNGFQTGPYVTQSPLSQWNITQADIVTDVAVVTSQMSQESHDFTVRPRKSREMRPTSLVLSTTTSMQAAESPDALQPTRRISSSTHL